jgi:hypothetical protein
LGISKNGGNILGFLASMGELEGFKPSKPRMLNQEKLATKGLPTN